jgi:hypothetical protein
MSRPFALGKWRGIPVDRHASEQLLSFHLSQDAMMIKKVDLVLCLTLLAALWWTPASAVGAIAVGVLNNVGTSGVAVGMNGDFKTTSAAQADALKNCRASKVKASVRALCKVASTYRNQCSAVAMDSKGGEPGLGWAVANSSSFASGQALAQCRTTAGGRGWACKVVATQCDGKAR